MIEVGFCESSTTAFANFWFDLVDWIVEILEFHYDMDIVFPVCSEFSWPIVGCPIVHKYSVARL